MYARAIHRAGFLHCRVAQLVERIPVGVQRIFVKVINTGGDTLAE